MSCLRTLGLLVLLAPMAMAQPGQGMEDVRTVCEPSYRCDDGPLASIPGGALAVGAVAAGLAGVGVWYKRAPIVLLFTRLRRDRLLAHPVRAAIVATVDAQPGIHIEQLRRDLGIANGAARYHIDVLCHARLLVRHRDQGYVCLLPPNPFPASPGAARSPLAQRVLAQLDASQPATAADLAHAVRTSRGNVHHHLRRMEAGGLVTARRDGRALRWMRSD